LSELPLAPNEKVAASGSNSCLPVDKISFVDGSQSGGDLGRFFERAKLRAGAVLYG
jgi:hypothetical protein